MRYAIYVAVPVAPPLHLGRLLAEGAAERIRDARAWVARNRETWRGALEPGETMFVAWVFEDGTPILTIDHERDDWGKGGVEHGRATLREMKAVRPKTTKTTEGGTT